MDETIIDELIQAPAGLHLVDEAAGRAALAALADEGPNAIVAACQTVSNELDKQLGHTFSRGSFRRVWIRGGIAVKAPNCVDAMTSRFTVAGVWHNLHEVHCHVAACYEVAVAPCKTVWHESGIPLTVMEEVHHDTDTSVRHAGSYPTGHADLDRVDGSQLGWSKLLQTWVAFDAGSPADYNEGCEVLLQPLTALKLWLSTGEFAIPPHGPTEPFT